MLTTFTVDTHQVFATLNARGYTKEQAEGLVEVVKQLNLDKMATKEDLVNLENRLTSKIEQSIEQSEGRLRAELEKLELRMTIKSGAFTFLLGGFLAAIKFLN